MRILNNDSGMSLVGVMVAIGLTGVLALILMNLAEQQSKQQKKAEVDGEMQEIFGQFRSMIGQSDSCTSTFVGLKKGDTFKEFRYDFDHNKPSFAESDIEGKVKFRGTKISLTEMRILTDQEVRERGLHPDTKTVVLEVTFKKPEGILGAQIIKKTFDVPTKTGQGNMISEPTKAEVAFKCGQIGGELADFETGEKTDESGIMELGANHYLGYCVIPNRTSNSYILHCTSTR
jgi:type II secretory pathway pseudopilin PulG